MRGGGATSTGALDWFEVDIRARPAFSFRVICVLIGYVFSLVSSIEREKERGRANSRETERGKQRARTREATHAQERNTFSHWYAVRAPNTFSHEC